MKNPFYITLSGILVFSLLLLFIPLKKKDKEQKNDINHTLEQREADLFENNQKDSILTFVKEIQYKIKNTSDSTTLINDYTKIINKLNNSKYQELAALNVYRKANIIKNTNSWMLTADNFVSLLFSNSIDSTLNNDLIEKAKISYQNSIQLEPKNKEAKIKLAQVYMELLNEPMSGVVLLKEIIKIDSFDLNANLLLAKFGIQSAQYEKALMRVSNALEKSPLNIDALLLRAEIYTNTNNNDKAIKDLELVSKSKEIDKVFKNQILLSIQNLKKKNL